MIRVITYGTFDLFHEGHRRLLERAKALGDELVVGVTSDAYDASRGKLNVSQPVIDRVKGVRQSGFADRIIIEEYDGQKLADIQKLGIDIFAIGSDWKGDFDYLQDYCQVVYLDRTRGISSTQLRNAAALLRLGVVGTGHSAARMTAEARSVSGVDILGAYDPNVALAEEFARFHELAHSFRHEQELYDRVDAVYVATDESSRAHFVKRALAANCHVLCQPPLCHTPAEMHALYRLAADQGLVLLEAIRPAFAPAFERLVAAARSGSIGQIRALDVTCCEPSLITDAFANGAPDHLTEWLAYALLPVVKLLGEQPRVIRGSSTQPLGGDNDQSSRIDLAYSHALASAWVGTHIVARNELFVSGTTGCIRVPAPWWHTEYFEIRSPLDSHDRRIYAKLDGGGWRHALAEFASMIREDRLVSFRLRPTDSLAIAHIIEQADLEILESSHVNDNCTRHQFGSRPH